MEFVDICKKGKMESEIKSYRDLIVWQKSMDLVTSIYELTAVFPKSEMY